MKIKLTKEIKIRLLAAIQDGELDMGKFPELMKTSDEMFANMTDNELREYICGDCPHFKSHKSNDNTELNFIR